MPQDISWHYSEIASDTAIQAELIFLPKWKNNSKPSTFCRILQNAVLSKEVSPFWSDFWRGSSNYFLSPLMRNIRVASKPGIQESGFHQNLPYSDFVKYSNYKYSTLKLLETILPACQHFWTVLVFKDLFVEKLSTTSGQMLILQASITFQI